MDVKDHVITKNYPKAFATAMGYQVLYELYKAKEDGETSIVIHIVKTEE